MSRLIYAKETQILGSIVIKSYPRLKLNSIFRFGCQVRLLHNLDRQFFHLIPEKTSRCLKS